MHKLSRKLHSLYKPTSCLLFMSGCPFNPNNAVDTGATAPPPTAAAASSGSSDVSPNPPHSSILGFAAANRDFFAVKPHAAEEPCHYSSYLAIEELQKLQDGHAHSKPEGKGLMHHEELTFIIVHQVFELWFKLVFADLSKSREFLTDITAVPELVAHQRMSQCISYLRRADTIFQHVLGAFTVMETMHPADFLEFRDFLVPASGFQSVAFRSLEQLLGVQNEGRAKVNGAEVFSYLKQFEQDKLAEERRVPSINEYVVEILSRIRVPDNFLDVYIATTEKVLRTQQYDIARATPGDPRAEALIAKGIESMQAMLADPVAWSDGLFLPDDQHEKYKRAVVGALFVIAYRNEPRFALLASLCDEFIAVEEGLVLWRGRHMSMAERMIGRRSGTGGTSSGVGYLDVTRRYRIFHCLWLVRKMFIRSSALPPLGSFGFDGKSIFIE